MSRAIGSVERTNSQNIIGPILQPDAPYLAAIDPTRPRAAQVYQQIRGAILDRGLAAGQRLPASRVLAHRLRVSRNTVVAAYDRLAADGFIETRRGAGAFVVDLPTQVLSGQPTARSQTAISRRAEALTRGLATRHRDTDDLRLRPFTSGLPDLTAFPFATWARLLAQPWRTPDPADAFSPDPAGLSALRAAVAHYLQSARDLKCHPQQIIIVSGAQAAIDLTARLLLDPGDQVWTEEPGYPGTAAALRAVGAVPVPVRVDGDGFDVVRAVRTAPRARLACISPTHQFPLGMPLALPRRLELLDWASRTGAIVLEDDYDGAYRYVGKPLEPLFNLAPDRVIYVGTLSRVMFPGIRTGFMVVPEPLIAPLLKLRTIVDGHPPVTAQPALARFIAEGHLAAHIRRTRTIYAARQRHLHRLAKRWRPALTIRPRPGGMHVVGRLHGGITDTKLTATASAAGIALRPLSTFYAGRPRRDGVVLGYAGYPEADLTAAAAALADVLHSMS